MLLYETRFGLVVQRRLQQHPDFVELDVKNHVQLDFINAARDVHPVGGLTHNFYRYPARFSPTFVRAAIEAFTRPGDLILDPFMGGGTSLVEALALGRHAIGVDISTLAQFVCSVKTTLFSDKELRRLDLWASELSETIHMHRPAPHFKDWEKHGYYKHLNHHSRWRLRKAIEQTVASAVRLSCARLEAFSRCVALRTAQWALDGRKSLPSVAEFREALVTNANAMVLAAQALRDAASAHQKTARVHLLNRSTIGLHEEGLFEKVRPPRLVLMSPPYPGVHVLYHRWQVDGRKETSAPFGIANKLDGSGGAYYTMGDRKSFELRTYFDNLRATMKSVAALCDKETVVVQMIAFSDPSWQLERYLQVMEETGLAEVTLPLLRDTRDGRLWRSVPNRRWYSDQRGKTPGSQEVVLIHRKRIRLDRAERVSAIFPLA